MFFTMGVFKLYTYIPHLSPFSMYIFKSPRALLFPPQNLSFQSKTQEDDCKLWSHHHWCA
jgi:hypothetical protein